MQGLLGTSIDDPRTLGLLQMAAALSSGRKFMPALAQGLLARQQVVQGAADAEEAKKDRALRRGLLDMQVKEAEARQRQQQGMEEAYRNALRTPEQMAMAQHGGPTIAAAQAAPGMQPGIDQNALIRGLMQSNPIAAAQMLQPKPADLMALSPGQVVFNRTTGKEQFRAPDKEAEQPAAVREYQFAQQQGYRGTFQQFQLEQKRAGASNTSVSYGTPVAALDAQGNPVFVQPSKDGSAPHVIPGLRPPKSAAEERAAGEQRDRARQAEQMTTVMKDAAAILQGGRATSSGIGNVADIGARAVGVSTRGAQDAARLEALSGWLVANVPRMEGPQSNYDVQNYITMAGRVGDRTVPIAERMAALEQVRGLQQKYAQINGTPLQQQQAPASGGWSIRPLGGN